MTTLDLIPDVKALYERNCMGCCLHVALDDGNLKDKDVQFCIDFAVGQNHPECEDLGRKLLELSQTQRAKLKRTWYTHVLVV